MKLLLVTIGLLSTLINAQGWVARLDGQGDDEGYAIATDVSGSVYVAGQYRLQGLSLYDTSGVIQLELLSPDSTSSFIAKYSSSGQVLWAAQQDGGGVDVARSLTTDSDGNVYVSGQFQNTLGIYGGNGILAAYLVSGTFYSAFLIKYTSTGGFMWAVKVQGGGAVSAFTVKTDYLDQVYIAGNYGSSGVTVYDAFGQLQWTLAGSQSQNQFLVKLSSAGAVIFAIRQYGGEVDNLSSLSIDSFGNMYIAGTYRGSDFDIYDMVGYKASLPTSFNTHTYLVKYQSNGVYDWSCYSTAVKATVAVTGDGEAYLAGHYGSGGMIAYDTMSGSVSYPSGANGYIIKFSADGQIVWSGKVTAGGGALIYKVHVTSTNEVLVGGYYQNAPLIAYGDSPLVSHTVGDQVEEDGAGFLFKYSSEGIPLWAVTVDGNDPDFVNDLTTDLVGNVFMTGQSGSSTVTVYDALRSQRSYPDRGLHESIFLAKFNRNGGRSLIIEPTKSKSTSTRTSTTTTKTTTKSTTSSTKSSTTTKSTTSSTRSSTTTKSTTSSTHSSTTTTGTVSKSTSSVSQSTTTNSVTTSTSTRTSLTTSTSSSTLVKSTSTYTTTPSTSTTTISKSSTSSTPTSTRSSASTTAIKSTVPTSTATVIGSSTSDLNGLPSTQDEAVATSSTEVFSLFNGPYDNSMSTRSTLSVIQVTQEQQQDSLQQSPIVQDFHTLQHITLTQFGTVEALSSAHQTRVTDQTALSAMFNSQYSVIMLGSTGFTIILVIVLIWFYRYKRVNNVRQKSIMAGANIEDFHQFQTAMSTQYGSSQALNSAMFGTSMITAVNSSYELAIPGFLELEYGTDFRQGGLIAYGGSGVIAYCQVLDPQKFHQTKKGVQLVAKNFEKNVDDMNQSQKAAFYQELSMLWMFRDQPTFVKMYGYSIQPATIVLQYYPKGSLKDYVSSKGSGPFPYSKKQLHFILTRLACGIMFMHSKDYAHADVKADNVLLEVEGPLLTPLITDFGISKLVNQSQAQVKAFQLSNVRGLSIAYAAPETLLRFRRKLANVEGSVFKAGDVYSLAILVKVTLERINAWAKV